MISHCELYMIDYHCCNVFTQILYSENDHIHLSSEAQCVSHFYPQVDCHRHNKSKATSQSVNSVIAKVPRTCLQLSNDLHVTCIMKCFHDTDQWCPAVLNILEASLQLSRSKLGCIWSLPSWCHVAKHQ